MFKKYLSTWWEPVGILWKCPSIDRIQLKCLRNICQLGGSQLEYFGNVLQLVGFGWNALEISANQSRVVCFVDFRQCVGFN